MKTILGVQTHFSFHWGTSSPAAWFARAEELGYTRIGFADNAALHGLPEMVKLGEKSPVRPLYGATFRFLGGNSVQAYVLTPSGYGNLCRRITEWHILCARLHDRAGGVPALDDEAAREHFQDQNLTGGLAFIVDDRAAWRALRRAGAETYWRVGPTLAAPPRDIDPESTVLVPGPFMLAPDEFETHRLLRAIGGATTLDRIPPADGGGEAAARAPVLTGAPDAWLAPPAAYIDAFAVHAEAIARADALGDRLAEFTPCRDTIYPPVPDDAGAEPGADESPLARLRRLAYEGAVVRYGKLHAVIRDRLDMELDLIARKGFAEYFLVVNDIVGRLAGGDGRLRRGRSVTCGRGSGAASLVNYCLGVTNVDAVKHDLMFERFLNEARSDPPDIDVDFAWDERDDLLERVFANYGDRRVGRVANHNRYDWRGAFRAVARALGYADPEISRHLRESPSVYAEAVRADPPPEADGAPPPPSRTDRKLGVLRRQRGSDWDRAAELARRLVDIPHCLSMHCGGVVISPDLLARSVPVVRSRKGQPTIQWEKDGSEDMGLVKIDLLGNRSLAVIRDAVRAVAHDRGMAEDQVIRGDPTDDPATQDLLRRGDTFGVFYLESPSMRLLMAKARRGDFAHAVIHSSIIRPAANDFINEYLARLHGKPWEPEHELIAGLFDESYGIPVYQEDVVKLAMALAGYDYARADDLRRCLGKRDARERLNAAYPALEKAALARNVDAATMKRFRDTLMSMTGYSFCKPHSASYARVSYEAAYIRAHYPAYFIAAVLSNGGGFYSTQAYVSEAMRLGLRVLGPDVSASDAKWRAEGPEAVRTGLMAVSGLSRAAMAAVTAEREKGGRYRGVEDFFHRVGLAVDDMRLLALVGALDSLAPGLNRPQLIWCASQAALAVSGPADRYGARGVTGSLFDRPAPGAAEADMLEPVSDRLRAPDLPAYSRMQRLEAEYSVLGFLPGRHPLALYEDDIRATALPLRRRRKPLLVAAGELEEHVGELVTVLAWPVSAKIVETRHGDAMMFQSFEDHRTLFESVIFPEEFQRFHRLLSVMQPLWVTGRVLEEFRVVSLQVMGVHPAQRPQRRAPTIPRLPAAAGRSMICADVGH